MTIDRYNVLIIMSDQHSKHHVGCYGDDLVRTPNLDRLASEGMLFINAYTPSPVCAPARMSFLTGWRPSAHRVWRNFHTLHSQTPTWAHSLGAAGYETALMGKMHFQGPDLPDLSDVHWGSGVTRTQEQRTKVDPGSGFWITIRRRKPASASSRRESVRQPTRLSTRRWPTQPSTTWTRKRSVPTDHLLLSPDI